MSSAVSGVYWKVNYGELSERPQFRIGKIESNTWEAKFPVAELADLISVLQAMPGLAVGVVQKGAANQARKVSAGLFTDVIVEPRLDSGVPAEILRFGEVQLADLVYTLQLLATDLANKFPDDWDFSDAPADLAFDKYGRVTSQLAQERLEATVSEMVPVVNDGVMASVAADQASAFSTQLNASIETAVPPLLVPAFALAGVSDDYVWTGDSLSAQGGGTGVAPGSYLAGITGRGVDIDAVGGETTAGIAARLNAAPLLMQPEGGSIPISGAVKVTFTSPTGMTVWPLLQTAGNPAIAKVWVGTLAGVHGTLSLVQPSGASANHRPDDYYNFTRTSAGAAVSVSRPAPFLIDYGVTHAGKFHVIWAGRNDLASASVDIPAVLATLDMIVQKIIAEGGDFVVLSVLNGSGEGSGTAAHTRITSFNDQIAARYPRRYVDIRGELIDRGLSLAGITPTSQDNTDIANDIVPDSLRTDSVHLEVVAREAVAKIVHEYLRYFGRLDAPKISVADDFNRADATNLGADWVAGHDYQIVGNQLTRVGTSTTPAILESAVDLDSADMEVSVDVVTRGGSASVGLIVRYVDANNYIAARINLAQNNVLIYKVIGGTTSSLQGADGLWPSDPARLTLRVVGDTYTVLRNGVQIIATTQVAPEVAAGSKVAVRTASAVSKPVLDNFEAHGL